MFPTIKKQTKTEAPKDQKQKWHEILWWGKSRTHKKQEAEIT